MNNEVWSSAEIYLNVFNNDYIEAKLLRSVQMSGS